MLKASAMPKNRLPRAKSFQLLTSPFSAIFLVLLLIGLSWAQATPSQPQSNPPAQSPNRVATPSQPAAPQTQAQPPNPSGATQVPGAGVSVQNQQQGSTPASAEKPESQTPITKAQAKELFRSVDEILDFASHDTGLPIQHKVKRNLITRESVER
jgi:cytoskeletal protein RodZ